MADTMVFLSHGSEQNFFQVKKPDQKQEFKTNKGEPTELFHLSTFKVSIKLCFF